MNEEIFLADRFAANRGHLRAVAYRMLGSASEAEDAVQEAWLRLARTDAQEIDNLSGWLTTVVARVCLDMLRQRKSRREEQLETEGPDEVADETPAVDPERELAMADAVGLALLVVLEKLAPAERIVFVLTTCSTCLSTTLRRSSNARRSRQGSWRAGPGAGSRAATRRVRPTGRASGRLSMRFRRIARRRFRRPAGRARPQRAVPRRHCRRPAGRGGRAAGCTGRGAKLQGRAQGALPALVDGAIGLLVAPMDKLRVVLMLKLDGYRIIGIDAVADPDRLAQLDVALLD